MAVIKKGGSDIVADRVVLAFVVLGVLFVIAGVLFVFWAQAKSSADLQAVKSELVNSRAGLVTFPVTDWTAVAFFSLGSLAVGLAVGWWLKERMKTSERR